MSSNARVVSLEYLRGIAALLVLYAHVVIVGGTDPVGPKSYFPMIDTVAAPPENYSFWRQLIDVEIWLESFGVNAGHLGVGIFFLISGYVIMALIEKVGPSKFLIGRFFRIIPLSALVTLGGAAVFASYLAIRGHEQTYDLETAIESSVLLPTRHPPMPVIWSLIAECWFYGVIAAAVAIRRNALSFSDIIVTSVGCLTVVVAVASNGAVLPSLISASYSLTFALSPIFVAYNLTFVSFILIGSAVYRTQQSKRYFSGVATIGLLFGIFLACFRLYDQMFPGTLGFAVANAVASMIVFSAFLMVNRLIPRMRIAQFFADISYPLYLVHIPLSWLLLFWMTRHGMNGFYAMILTCATCIAAAYVLHIFVEMPTHRYGKSFADEPKDPDALSRPLTNLEVIPELTIARS
jgi:peptidoglycan/LPS O-acetylase OafA/YrhL